ncbi:alpha-glucoside-specific PTS transporter subunit IIBC [Clostridium sp. DJ247]|uniref:alpha-glucoside-specific PTS transporter subunit IIBC n=1 Tax=Clostridium sp. DJ247 TaxID=2726188 RepID=UPI00162AA075|nr:alpha-glucoside-specific PTS transporter subunit IIBC [Clostridium sp. DJ247]MBC2582148.1 PTS transporter subunit EIIC [Clostridium sp. DJ247]
MMQKIQRFGAAMFVPVLLFGFAGMTVGLSILFMNQDIMGSIANPNGLWYKFWFIIQEGSWTVFRQLPLLFVVGLPIALAKKAQARACLEALVTYLTCNYFISAILTLWGPSFGVNFKAEVGGTSGLTMIAGIKTLDTGMIGSILIAAIVVYLHERFFSKKLPDFLGIFQGSCFVVIVGFFVMIPVAFAICLLWPKVQSGIGALQGFLTSSGVLGVWVYTFLERILIPTGLHHFVYGPFIFGPAIVEGGIAAYWPQHLSSFATSAHSLKEMFPAGGFALHGSSKVFGCTGIALAMYSTARPEKKKVVAGLLIPATLTAIIAGITEPLEFTFLFIAPVLFGIHAFLAGTLAATLYAFGVSGNFGGGVIDWLAQNWLPLFKYHSGTYITQVVIGLCFTAIYFFVFRFAILKFNFATPGREQDDEETKLYTKADYKAKQAGDTATQSNEVQQGSKAMQFLQALGGSENIQDVTNCATRLRVSVKDETKLAADKVFRAAGAHGVVRNGKAIQVIVGLSVPQVREEFESLLGQQVSV